MMPLHAARIEDLSPGDLVVIECAACDHVAVLTADHLAWRGACKLLNNNLAGHGYGAFADRASLMVTYSDVR